MLAHDPSESHRSAGADRLTGIELRGLEGLAELLETDVFASVESAELIAARLRDVLGVPTMNRDIEVSEGETWVRDGVRGQALRWNVGFGPDTEAWLLRPDGETGELPGLLALHCHSDVKFTGKEKIADGPASASAAVLELRAQSYGGRAWANEMARSGMAVLVHDVFGWGSRRALPGEMSPRSERYAALAEEDELRAGIDLDEGARYELHAGPHEDALAKVLGVLGTSWGGVVVREDLIAARILAARPGVESAGITVAGMSGGGTRAVLASALSDDIRAVGVMSMMSTFRDLVDGYVNKHTWMLLNPGIGRVAEWPDIAAARVPRPLFVAYAANDELFPLSGLRASDKRIRGRYEASGASDRYHAHWEHAPHSFGVEMQDAFIEWHRRMLAQAE